MIFYRFLLNTQPLGYLFVLEMLLAAHAINHLALLRHAFYHHVDEQCCPSKSRHRKVEN